MLIFLVLSMIFDFITTACVGYFVRLSFKERKKLLEMNSSKRRILKMDEKSRLMFISGCITEYVFNLENKKLGSLAHLFNLDLYSVRVMNNQLIVREKIYCIFAQAGYFGVRHILVDLMSDFFFLVLKDKADEIELAYRKRDEYKKEKENLENDSQTKKEILALVNKKIIADGEVEKAEYNFWVLHDLLKVYEFPVFKDESHKLYLKLHRGYIIESMS